MQIDIKTQAQVSILHLKGNLDAETVTLFKKKAYALVEAGNHCLVVDCKGLNFVDSMGLGAMISLLRKVRTEKGDLKVAALSPDVRSVFEITRLHRLFEIFPDWEAACQNFS